MSELVEEAQAAMNGDLSQAELEDIQLERIYQQSLNPVVDQIAVTPVPMPPPSPMIANDISSAIEAIEGVKPGVVKASSLPVKPKTNILREVEEIAAELYGEENVDIQHLRSSNQFKVLIKFKDVRIRNSRNGSALIDEIMFVYTFVDFAITGKLISSNLQSTQGVRIKFSLRHYEAKYHHSHLPGGDTLGVVQSFCLGSGELAKASHVRFSLSKEDYLNKMYALLMAAKDYIEWESITGGPYYSLSGISPRNGRGPVPLINSSSPHYGVGHFNTIRLKRVCSLLGLDIYDIVEVNMEGGLVNFQINEPKMFFLELVDKIDLFSSSEKYDLDRLFYVPGYICGYDYIQKRISVVAHFYNRNKEALEEQSKKVTPDSLDPLQYHHICNVNGLEFKGEPIQVFAQSSSGINRLGQNDVNNAEYQYLTNSLSIKFRPMSKLKIANLLNRNFSNKLKNGKKNK